jgi:hypothetical protein
MRPSLRHVLGGMLIDVAGKVSYKQLCESDHDRLTTQGQLFLTRIGSHIIIRAVTPRHGTNTSFLISPLHSSELTGDLCPVLLIEISSPNGVLRRAPHRAKRNAVLVDCR